MTRSVTRHTHETLQRLKEAEELVVRPIARGVSLEWDGLCQRLFFHGERRFEVDLSGFHRLMPSHKAMTERSTPAWSRSRAIV
jgi:hypothetical protein